MDCSRVDNVAGDDARKRELGRQICQEATQDDQRVKYSLHEHDEALSLIGTIEAARQSAKMDRNWPTSCRRARRN